MVFLACMDRFGANSNYGMPNPYFGDHLDPEFIPKLIPMGPNGDELGIFLIYGSNRTKFLLSGPFWLIIRLRWLILILWMIWTRIHPQKDSMGMNWGQTLFIGLIVQEFFLGNPFGKE